MIGFEDQSNQGDRDFGDLVIRVDIANQIVHTLPPVEIFPDIETTDGDSTPRK